MQELEVLQVCFQSGIYAYVTNQKVLGAILILFILAGGGYFAYTKLKQEISSVTASPSPSPSDLQFLFNQQSNQTPPPSGSTPVPSQAAQSGQSASSSLQFAKNKYVGHFPGILRSEVLANKKAVIETGKGNIEIEIYADAPRAASNFLLLSVNGYYDGLTFHRVEPNFVIQGGDPLGDGTGGPGYTFEDEVIIREYTRGIVAMANAGANTNGSQFFILLSDHPELPKKYTIFGNVIAGMDVVEKVAVGDVMKKVTIQNLR